MILRSYSIGMPGSYFINCILIKCIPLVVVVSNQLRVLLYSNSLVNDPWDMCYYATILSISNLIYNDWDNLKFGHK